MGNLLTIPTAPVKQSYVETYTTDISVGTSKKVSDYNSYYTVSSNIKDGMFNTIQGAINALPDEGGTIYLRAGTHIVGSTIPFPNKNIEMIGENGSIIDFSTMTSGSVFYLYNLTKTFLFRGIEFYSSVAGSGRYSIFVNQPGALTHELNVEYCFFNYTYNSNHVAIMVSRSTTYGQCSVRVHKNKLYRAALYLGSGLGLSSDKVTVSYNDLEDTDSTQTGSAIRVSIGPGMAVIQGNKIHQYGRSCTARLRGIYANSDELYLESNSVVFEPNVTSNLDHYGLQTEGSKLVIRDNTVELKDTSAQSRGYLIGIYVSGWYSVGSCTITNNKVALIAANCHMRGISLGPRENGAVTGNSVYVGDPYGTLGSYRRYALYALGDYAFTIETPVENITVSANNFKASPNDATSRGVYLANYVHGFLVSLNIVEVGSSGAPTYDAEGDSTFLNNITS